MKAVLSRTSSCQVLVPSIGSCSPITLTCHSSSEGVSFSSTRRNPLHCLALRRTRSEADVDLPGWRDSCIKAGLKQAESNRPQREGREKSVRILDEEKGEGALMIGRRNWNLSGVVTERAAMEELGFGGGGSGKGRKTGGGDGGRGEGRWSSSGGGADRSRMGAYYKEMLKANPGNPLLLMNYGRYLHEVEKDAAKAEDCYERANLAGPADGEVLSLFGVAMCRAHFTPSLRSCYAYIPQLRDSAKRTSKVKLNTKRKIRKLKLLPSYCRISLKVVELRARKNLGVINTAPFYTLYILNSLRSEPLHPLSLSSLLSLFSV